MDMKVQELIEALMKLPQDQEVMVLDGSNGGGHPRTLNLGPLQRAIRQVDVNETADCEERYGEWVVVLGYGCY
jgi:hypothetical protein